MDNEALELSAPIAWQMAPKLCRTEGATGQDCSWLHRFWPCLRLVGLAATPDRHSGFYQEAFDGVVADKRSPRLLVSGAADYAMLELALGAFRNQGVEAQFSVIDVCDTPLHLNRWYADRAMCAVETSRCSLLEYAPDKPFDAICTHSFFGQFAREQRPKMIASWRRLLRPGGLVVTTLPLRPGPDEGPNSFTAEQAASFRAVVRSSAGLLGRRLGVDPSEVVHHGEAYLKARYGYAVRTDTEVRELFESSGFEIRRWERGVAPTEEGLDAGGPGLRRKGGEYLSVVALRR
jgi:SAM-dependent methyltransferase